MRFGLFSKTRPCFHFPGRHFFTFAVAGLSLSLVSCAKQEIPGTPVAKVNGSAITAYHVENALRHSEAGQAGESRAGVLQTLIDRKLLQDEALRHRLDRDPTVLSAIENAKAKILAQAYLQSQRAYVAPPTREEIQAYFDRHPDKFAKRKLFHVKEIALASAELSGELKSAMDQAHSLDDVVAWLDGRRIAYSLGRHIRNSAEMPPALMAKLQDAQAGQMFAVREGDEAYLLAITSFQESPVSFEAALPQIERVLLEEKGRQRGQSELTRLRASSKVAYQPGNNPESFAGAHAEGLQAAAGGTSATPQARHGTAQ